MHRKFALATTLIFTSWFVIQADYSEHEEVAVLVDELVSEYSFDAATLMSVFKKVKNKPKIIEIWIVLQSLRIGLSIEKSSCNESE